MKIRFNNTAVAEFIGAVFLLGMAVMVFSVVYLNVLSEPGPNPEVFVTITGKVEDNNPAPDVVFELERGNNLGMDTKVDLFIGGKLFNFTVGDSSLLDDEGKNNGYWNIGEKLVYSGLTNVNISNWQVKANIYDRETNSMVWWGILQDGELLEKLGGVWHFDEQTGIKSVDVMNNNNGTLKSETITGRLPTWDTILKRGSIGSSLRFNGRNFVQVPGNSLTLDITDGLTVEGWFKLPDNNVLGDYIFSPDFGYYPTIFKISNSVYGVAYQDQTIYNSTSKPGVIKTVNIDDNGTISSYIYNNEYVFEDSKCYWPNVIHAYDDIYLVSFVEGDPDSGATPSDGQLKTVQIFSNGTIDKSFSCIPYSFGPKEVYEPDLIHIHDNICALVYRNESANKAKHVGFLRTVQITDNGLKISPVPSVNSLFVFAPDSCYDPSIIHISGNNYAIIYRDKTYNGKIKLITIEPNGNIINMVPFTKQFSKGNCYEPEIISVYGNIFAIAYRDYITPDKSIGYICTVKINDLGIDVIDTKIFETSFCVLPRIDKTFDDFYSIVYQADRDFKLGYLTNIEINPITGIISLENLEKLRFNNGDGNIFAHTPDIIHVYDDIVALVYRSGSKNNPHQGILTTMKTGNYDFPNVPYDQKGICKEDSYALYMNHTLISGTIKDITYSIPFNCSSGWRHIALTYSKTTDAVILYVNATPVITTKYVDADLRNNNPIYFGRYFYGNIDEVAIYPKVLDQSIIQEHMNSPISLENVFIDI